MKEFVCVNVVGGTRISIEGEDILAAAQEVLILMYDLNKEWDANKVGRYDEEDAMMITGINRETGSNLMTLLVTKEKFDEDSDLYKNHKSVN